MRTNKINSLIWWLCFPFFNFRSMSVQRLTWAYVFVTDTFIPFHIIQNSSVIVWMPVFLCVNIRIILFSYKKPNGSLCDETDLYRVWIGIDKNQIFHSMELKTIKRMPFQLMVGKMTVAATVGQTKRRKRQQMVTMCDH